MPSETAWAPRLNTAARPRPLAMPPAAMTGTGATASTTAGSGVDSEVSRGGGVAIPVGPSLGRLGDSRRHVARAREAERCRIPSHDSVGALGGAETRRPAAGRRTDAVARGRSEGLPSDQGASVPGDHRPIAVKLGSVPKTLRRFVDSSVFRGAISGWIGRGFGGTAPAVPKTSSLRTDEHGNIGLRPGVDR